jgi:hypothetical protein
MADRIRGNFLTCAALQSEKLAEGAEAQHPRTPVA